MIRLNLPRLVSRRCLLQSAAAAGVVAYAWTAVPAPAQRASSRAMLQRLVDGGGGAIYKRAQPYFLDGPVMIPAGCRLEIEPGTTFVCDFPRPAGSGGVDGVFVVTGNDVVINVTGSEGAVARVTALQPDASRYAVLSRGHSNLVVLGIEAIDCSHVFCGASTESYAQVVTSGPTANVARNVEITGGGARFARAPSPDGHAACTLQYTVGFTVAGCSYVNVRHGVQWWGGDASPLANGSLDQERKCVDGRVEGVTVTSPVGASVWGSMGRNITVSDCTGTSAGDVGFDAEGSVDVTFQRCTQRNAKNGCFSVFFYNRGIVFADCNGYQEASDTPIFRLYNDGQSFENRDITVRGGRFECGGMTPGTFDDRSGNVRKLTVIGAMFINVALQFDHDKNHDINISDNRLTFPRRSLKPFTAIRVGRTHREDGNEGSAIVSRNVIASNVMQIPGSTGIVVHQDDSGGSPQNVVHTNQITGFPDGIKGEWVSTNAAMRAHFEIHDNFVAEGGIKVVTQGKGQPASVANARNKRRNGRLVELSVN